MERNIIELTAAVESQMYEQSGPFHQLLRLFTFCLVILSNEAPFRIYQVVALMQ